MATRCVSHLLSRGTDRSIVHIVVRRLNISRLGNPRTSWEALSGFFCIRVLYPSMAVQPEKFKQSTDSEIECVDVLSIAYLDERGHVQDVEGPGCTHPLFLIHINKNTRKRQMRLLTDGETYYRILLFKTGEQIATPAPHPFLLTTADQNNLIRAIQWWTRKL